MADKEFENALNAFCRGVLSPDGEISGLKRLSGGANMESWAFAFGGGEFVLRRMPGGELEDSENKRNLPLNKQADIIEIAVESGVAAPVVRARLEPKHNFGAGFLMETVAGEALPQKIIGNSDYSAALERLADDVAKQLAAIHAIDTAKLDNILEYHSPQNLIEQQDTTYRELGSAIPIFGYALHWLRENIPSETAACFVHGDFRMGNFLIKPAGLSAILDWELAHLGDPMKDIAYLCAPSWRFGHYTQGAGGFATISNFISAYEKHSGTTVDPRRFQFWLVYSTLWWGIACMLMGQSWRSGHNRSIERTVIGRRVSEVEIDLLMLLEGEVPKALQTPLDWKPPGVEPPTGETEYTELLTALSEWNKEAVRPELRGHTKFESLVAGNALGIAKRSLDLGAIYKAFSDKRLEEIGITPNQLCEGLSNGEIELSHPGLWDHLRLSAFERISIDQPKYAGYAVAREKWSGET